MADIEHMKRLTGSTAAWNVWRAANPSAIPDLRHATLGAREKQFGPISGGPINLRGAMLFKADLSEATLIEADLREAELVETNLRNARLNHANLSRANLTDAVLSGADLDGARFDGANLAGADLAAALNLTQAQVDRAIGDPTTNLPAAMKMPAAWLSRPGDGFAGGADAGPEENLEPKANLYEVLGVKKKDTAETINAAYRAKAKTVHPDVKPGDASAAREFHRLTRAYYILRDPVRRARYDRGEIDADGEETEAYADALARRERRGQFWRIAGLAAAGLALGALLAFGAWTWLAEDEAAPAPAEKVKVQKRN